MRQVSELDSAISTLTLAFFYGFWVNSLWSGREVFLANVFFMFLAWREEENAWALQPEPNCYDLMAIVMTSVQAQYYLDNELRVKLVVVPWAMRPPGLWGPGP